MLIDIFPPVLVKEVRQGLKTRAFALTLIGQQALMVITILFYLLGVSSGNDISFANGLFWFCFGVPLLAVMPSRGFQGIHEERTQQTLELLYLTRLSARQIVIGKWIALFAQALLIVIAILPYMVIRYFLGGINISVDLAVAGWLTLASGCLTALGIGLSAVEHKAIRVLIMIAAVLSIFPVLGMGMGTLMIGARMGGGGSPSPSTPIWVILSIIALCVLGGLYALFFGASLIAPQAENHALPKRILGLLGVVAITAMTLAVDEEALMAFIFPLLVFAGADALTEQPPRIWSVYARRNGKRWPLPLLLRPFLPGWPSGILYLLLLAVISYGLMPVFGSEIDDPGFLIGSLTLGVVFPLPIIFLMGKRINRIGPVYILIQIIHLILSILLMTAISSDVLLDAASAGLLPAATFLVTVGSESGYENACLLLWLVMGTGLVIIALNMRRTWRSIRRLDPVQKADAPITQPAT